MKPYPIFNKLKLYITFLVIFSFCLPFYAHAADDLCARVKIEIKQELTLERQAFDAHMRINNGLTNITLTDVGIEVSFQNENYETVTATNDPDNTDALFFIRLDSKENIDDVDGNGTIAPSTSADIHWLIIPAPGASNGIESGTLYYVGATLSYSLGGEEHETEVTPDYIYVKPMPELQLDYFLPNDVYGDDAFTQEIEPSIPFSLGVRVKNNGFGVARQLKINSAQPEIVENEQGLLINFHIEGSELNGNPATNSLLVDFGDIASGKSSLARWIMTTTLSGRFVKFTADISHSDELGGELTSLIKSEDLNTHFLIHDVLVDLPGRDTIRDFLAKDDDIVRIYESDSDVDSEVLDQSASATLQLEEDYGDEVTYKLLTPVTDGFFYVKLQDPMNGQKSIKSVVRIADQKQISEHNAWLDKTRTGSNPWQYFIHLFDANSQGAYLLTFEVLTNSAQKPVLQFISDKSLIEKERVAFLIEASDPNNTIPKISVTSLPVGAVFIDSDNGTGTFEWTPGEEQAGQYNIIVSASDGELTDRQHVKIDVAENTIPDADITPSESSGDEPLSIQFTDASTSDDGITEWEWDFGDGTTSTDQHTSHTFQQNGNYLVLLTVTDRNGDSDSTSVSITVNDTGPSAAFSLTSSGTDEPVNITLTNLSESHDGITSYLWDFGDNHTSTEENPLHTYTQNGTYTVSLTVQEDDDNSDTVTETITIDDTTPEADFAANPVYGNEPLGISFTDLSNAYDGITAWHWNFGDGQTGTDQNPYHTYDQDGAYTVTLTVTDNDGSADTYTITNMIDVKAVRTVCDSGCEHRSIQDAIDTCSDGDIVSVAPGVYYENIDFKGKAIVVRANNEQHFGSHETILDGQQTGSVVTFNTNEIQSSKLEGFTIRNGLAVYGGGILMDQASPVIDQCKIIANQAMIDGAGIYLTNASMPVIQHCDIKNNQAKGTGGGIFFDTDCHAIIQNCAILNNHASEGGGILVANAAPELSDIRLIGNTSRIGAALMAKSGSNIFIQRSIITQNKASDMGAGAYLDSNAQCQISNSLITHNDCRFNGGAFYASDALLTIRNCTISRNSATYGGAVFANNAEINIHNAIIWNNSDEIDDQNTTLNISYSTIDHPTQYPGDGNINLDPLFVNEDNDFRLQSDSPCIDSGLDQYTNTMDINEKVRPFGNQIDLGAYEWNNAIPDVNFFSNVQKGHTPLSVLFTDSSISSQTIDSYLWSFGDNYTSTSQHPVHTYTASGLYDVSLTVLDSDGNRSTYQKYAYIDVRSANIPDLDFTAGPVMGYSPLVVLFTDLSVSSEYSITQWEWDFGDGNMSNDMHPSHTYTMPGNYSVTLKITTDEGVSYSLNKYNLVHVETLTNPLNFVATPTFGTGPLAVHFYGNSYDKNSTQWQWDFGDGAISNAKMPVHTYTETGTYNVSLSVSTPDSSYSITQIDVIHIVDSLTTINVCPDSCQYTRIQDAIDAATDGDVIIVSDGIYHEHIHFKGKAIHVRSLNGKSQTIIDGNNAESVVRFIQEENSQSIIEGFTIQNGYSRFGGGIYIEASAPVIKNCDILNNEALKSGGGIASSDNANPTLINCFIHDNQADYGAGISFSLNSSGLAYSISVSNNMARISGGGIFTYMDSSPVVIDSVIHKNIANVQGGGLYSKGAVADLKHSIFAHNISGFGGAISFMDSTLPVLSQCLISSNTSTNDGGGLYIVNTSAMDIINTIIANNHAIRGGGAYLDNLKRLDIDHATIADNGVTSEGHALYIQNSNHVIIKNTIIWNAENEIVLNNSTAPVIEYSNIRQENLDNQESSNIHSDPLFVLNGIDYHLGSGSPCRNTASDDSNIVSDIQGTIRPLGRGFDMGAYEEYNLTPVANYQQLTAYEDSPLTITLSATDGDNDPLTYILESQPLHGSLTQSDYTITYMPVPDYHGNDHFAFKVNDGFADSEAVIISLTLLNTNDAPVFDSTPDLAATEDLPYTYQIIVNDIDPDASIDIQSINLPDWLSLTDHENGTATLIGIPRNENVGKHSILIIADDGLITSPVEQQFTVTVININDAPELTFSPITSIIEDAADPYVVNYTLTDDEGGVMMLSVQTSDESLVAVNQISITGTEMDTSASLTAISGQRHLFSMSVIPVPNAFGTVTITITVLDTEPENISITESFALTIHAVNDPPSFSNNGGQTILEDSGTQRIENWATNVISGPENESYQDLDFRVSTNNSDLFTAMPVISISGTTGELIYTLKNNVYGEASVTVYLEDNGGVLRGGENRSESISFTVTVEAVNDSPSFTIGDDQEIIGYTGIPEFFTVRNWASGMSAGPLNESDQTLTFFTSNYNTDIITHISIATNGDLTYTPNQNANGTTTISVWLSDGEALNYSSGIQTFDISILAVNHAPAFTLTGDVTVNEDCGYTRVQNFVTQIYPGAQNEWDQVLSFNLVVDNPSIFQVQPAVEYTGTTGVLIFKPIADVFGHSDITITLKDNGGTANGGIDTYTPQHFRLTIVSVNDQPDFVQGPDVSLKQGGNRQTFSNWAKQITHGPANEPAGNLTFYAVSDTLTRVSNVSINPQTGDLTITPGNYTGIATISVWLSDNEAINYTSDIKTFKATIMGDNPPTISTIEDQNTPEDKITSPIIFVVNDEETADNALTISVESSNTLIMPEENIFVSAISASDRTIMLSPCNQSGSVEITVTVRDSYANTASESFTLTIHAKPYAEIAIDALSLTTGTAPHSVVFSATSVENTITGWAWNFGDEKTSSDIHPTHTYFLKQDEIQSLYSVTLTVFGPGGTYTTTRPDLIKVLKPMYVQFHATPNSGTIPLSTSFSDMSIGPEISYWEWDFGDGSSYTSTTVSTVNHTYTSAGNYTVSLTVKSDIFTYSSVRSNYIRAIGRAISGRITGSDGADDLSGYLVEIQSSDNVEGANTYTFTDENGYYELNNLPALDNYILSVWPPTGSDTYVYQYYGGTETMNLSTLISTLDENQTINIQLEKAPKDIIKGQIFDKNNNGIAGIAVDAFSDSIESGNFAITDDSGNYTITALKPATDYIVSVWSDTYLSDFYYALPDSTVFRENALMVESSESFSENITITIKLTGTISGQVTLENGTPLPDVWISAWSDEENTGNSALTNENGFYTINGLEDTLYYVEYFPDDYPYQVFPKASLRSFASKVGVNESNINFELKTGSSISGTIIDKDTRQRLSGVTVYAWSTSNNQDSTAQTDINGNYTITNIPIATDYYVMADAGNYPLQYFDEKQYPRDAQLVDITYGNVDNIDFALDKGPTIKGFVYINNTFTPAPSDIWVNVSSRQQGIGQEMPTDENGMFEITGLVDSDDYIISIWSEGDYLAAFYHENGTVYKYSDAGHVSPSDDNFRNIVLVRGLSIQGTVDAAHDSNASIFVEAWSQARHCYGYTQVSGLLNSGINYKITGLVPGSYQVTAKSDDFIERVQTVSISNTNLIGINFTLIQPEFSINGKIKGLAPEKTVQIKAWSDAASFGGKTVIIGNGGDMVYSISGLKPANDYRLELTSPDYPTQVYNGQTEWIYGDYVDISAFDVSDIDFELPELTVSISGTITFNNGTPGDKAYIDAWNSSMDSGKTLDVIFQGVNPVSYQIDGLNQDNYIVSVYSNKYQIQYYSNASLRENATVVNLNQSSQTGIDFSLVQGASIKGRVTDAHEQPAQNILVEIVSPSKVIWKGTQTDESGFYVIEGLDPALDYILSASEPGDSPFYFNKNGSVKSIEKSERIQLGQGEIKTGYDIQLREGEFISGTIRDSYGRGISGIAVDAYSSMNKSGNSTFSQEGGRYHIIGLVASKDYVVTVIPSSTQSYMPTFRSNVRSGSSGVDFVLREGFTLQGVVTSQSDGTPLKHVLIEVLSERMEFYDHVKTNRFGEYTIKGLPESDDYVIMATPPKKTDDLFLSQSMYNQFINSNTYLNISLMPAGKIDGNVYDSNNNPISNVTITAFSSEQNSLKIATTNHQGYYELLNIPQAQDYVITAIPPESSGFGEMKKHGVSTGQHIDFELKSGGEISGIVISDSGVIKGANVILSSVFLNLSKSIKTDKEGFFKFEALPESKNGISVSDYKLTVNASGYPKEVRSNIAIGSFVIIKMESGLPTELAGTVRDTNGTLLPSGFSKAVVIYVYDERGFKYLKRISASNDGTGAFLVKGLTPNTTYKLFFVIGNFNHYESALYDTSMVADFKFSNYTWNE